MASLIDALRAHVFAGDRLHGGDTPVPVLDPGRGSTREGRLWVYVRDGRPASDAETPAAAGYLYSPDRKGAHRAAGILSLVETAKLSSLDPERYLRDVLTRIAKSPDQPHRRAAAVEHRGNRLSQPLRTLTL